MDAPLHVEITHQRIQTAHEGICKIKSSLEKAKNVLHQKFSFEDIEVDDEGNHKYPLHYFVLCSGEKLSSATTIVFLRFNFANYELFGTDSSEKYARAGHGVRDE